MENLAYEYEPELGVEECLALWEKYGRGDEQIDCDDCPAIDDCPFRPWK